MHSAAGPAPSKGGFGPDRGRICRRCRPEMRLRRGRVVTSRGRVRPFPAPASPGFRCRNANSEGCTRPQQPPRSPALLTPARPFPRPDCCLQAWYRAASVPVPASSTASFRNPSGPRDAPRGASRRCPNSRPGPVPGAARASNMLPAALVSGPRGDDDPGARGPVHPLSRHRIAGAGAHVVVGWCPGARDRTRVAGAVEVEEVRAERACRASG